MRISIQVRPRLELATPVSHSCLQQPTGTAAVFRGRVDFINPRRFTSDQTPTMMQPHSDMMDVKSNGDETSKDRSPSKESDHSVIRAVRNFLRVVIPHMILLSVLSLYLGVGAVVFTKLEASNATDYNAERNALVNDLYDLIANLSTKSPHGNVSYDPNENSGGNISSVVDPESATDIGKTDEDEIREKIDEVMEKILESDWKIGRMESAQAGRTWTFPSAFLFCMTTITTIGYGDIAPVTAWGRAFCVIYAIIGIPLSLLCLASIGNLLARLTLKLCRFLHIKMYLRRRIQMGCCHGCVRPSKSRKRTNNNAKLSYQKDNVDAEPVKIALKDFGKFHPIQREENKGHRTSDKQNHYELAIQDDKDDSTVDQAYIRSISIATENPTSHPKGITTTELSTADDPEPGVCDHSQETQRVEVLEEVPLIIVLAILVAYIAGGAAMLAAGQGWMYGDGVYFVFITITTIGFGDVLPTKNYRQQTFVPCMFFTLFGLAVMSMCIALVQAKIIRAFKYTQKKLELNCSSRI